MESETITGPAADISVGSLISRSFSIMFQKPIIFLGLAAFSMLLVTIVEIRVEIEAISSILQQIVNLLFQGMASYAVFQTLRGRHVTFREALSRSNARFGTLLGLSLFTGLLIGIGTLLFIVPGLILSCMWAVVIPACVVEKLKVGESMTRSADLTKGYRMKILGLTTFLFVLILIVALAAGYVGTWVVPENETAKILLTNIILIIPQAFGYIMYAMIYYDLRAAKEGITVDALASVFD